jgi:diadenosine tetraphosphate (Ap4A) HIT family hydrolase
MAYDDDNVFSKILRGEIPSSKVFEDEFALAFHDIAAVRPVHVLVIPKGKYETQADFIAKAPDAQVVGFWRAVLRAVEEAGVSQAGYRLIVNTGEDGGQEVPHFHVHILGGGPVGRMISD